MFVEMVKNSKDAELTFPGEPEERREKTIERQQEAQLTVIPHLLGIGHSACARHRAKHSTCSISFKLHNNPMGWVLLLYPVYR